MASLSVSVGGLFSLWLLLLISPAHALTCTSQTFKNKKFDNCLDLPTLHSYLHYSYNATNSSLSIAFMAPPAKPEGWIAWAINPKGEGMIGSQALVAYKSNNKVVVETIDISSYSTITASKLSFETWDLTGEASSNGNLVIYGSLKVPEKTKVLNQVWQVGSEVADGDLIKHDFQPDNLNAKGKLLLEKSGGRSGKASPPPSPLPQSPSPSSSSSSSPLPAEDPVKGGQSLTKSNNLALFLCLILFVAGVFLH